MANVNDMLARIDAFAEARDNDKTIRENETKLKAEMLVEFINVNFADRIDAIVTIANHLVKNDIALKTNKYCRSFHDWREDVFISDGFYHQLGLYEVGKCNNRIFNGMRIAMGGACGNRTMIFNANDIYVQCENNYGSDTIDTPKTVGDIRNLEHFINEFERYENAFYKWVESVTNTDGFRTEYSIKNIIETDKYTICISAKFDK